MLELAFSSAGSYRPTEGFGLLGASATTQMLGSGYLRVTLVPTDVRYCENFDFIFHLRHSATKRTILSIFKMFRNDILGENTFFQQKNFSADYYSQWSILPYVCIPKSKK